MACTTQENQQGFKCTSSGVCYSCNSTATDALFKKLQASINQFAQVMIFTPIKVDGIIGPGTTTSTKLVLHNLTALLKDATVIAAIKAVNSQIVEPVQLAANAQTVVDALVLAAKQLNAPPAVPIPAPQPAPTVVQLATTQASKPPVSTSPVIQQQIKAIQATSPKLSASLLDRMPPWVAYAGGAGLAIAALATVFAVAKKRRGARAAAPAVAGW